MIQSFYNRLSLAFSIVSNTTLQILQIILENRLGFTFNNIVQ